MAETVEKVVDVLTLDADGYMTGLSRLSVELQKCKDALAAVENQETKTERGISSLGKYSSNVAALLGGTVGGVAGGIASSLIGKVTSEIKEGIASVDAYSAANKIFRGDLELLRVATRGHASDLTLMTSANRLATLGVQLTDKEMSALFEGVSKLSSAMGISLEDGISSATTALGRQSAMIADNLGIVMSEVMAQERYAATLGKTTKQLDENEKKLAFQIEFMRQLKTKTDALAEATPTLTGELKKLGTVIGNEVTATLATANQELGRWINQSAAHKKQLESVLLPTKGYSKGWGQEDLNSEIDSIQSKAQTSISTMVKDQATFLDKTATALLESPAAKKFRKAMLADPKGEDKWSKVMSQLDWETSVDEDVARMRLERKKRAAAAELKILEGQAEEEKMLRARNAELESREFEARQKTELGKIIYLEEARKKAREKLISRTEQMEGADIVKKLLPEESYQRFLEQMSTLDETTRSFAGNMISSAQSASQALSGALASAISGEKSLGQALKDSFHTWLSTKSEEWMFSAIEEGVRALVSVATYDYAGAAAHAAAAAGYAGLAALAGGGAALTATSSKTTASSSSKGSDRGLGGSSAAAARGGSTISLTYNINTVTANSDDVAILVTNGMAQAKSMGLAE